MSKPDSRPVASCRVCNGHGWYVESVADSRGNESPVHVECQHFTCFECRYEYPYIDGIYEIGKMFCIPCHEWLWPGSIIEHVAADNI